MFDKPDNEWLEGLLFVYNKDQDKTRKEIKRLIESSEFVDDEDYDDEGVSTIPTIVYYKHFSDTRSFGEYAANANKRTFRHQIQIRDEYHSYKYKDRFKLMEQSEDDKPYIITNVEYPKNTYRTKAVKLFPGLHDQYHSKAIVDLG